MNERFKNPMFWIGLIGVILSPILAYNGMGYEDLVTWEGLGELLMSFISNPYLIGSVVLAVLGALGVVVNPTTPGITDGTKNDETEDKTGE